MELGQLPDIILSGNFPEELTYPGQSIMVRIYKDSVMLLEEVYEHSGDSIIRMRFKDLFNSLLQTDIPVSGDQVFQTQSIADFNIEVVDEGVNSFRLVKGGIDSPFVDSASFLAANFLTWKPQVKKVQYLDPQWLTYYAAGKSRLVIQATWMEDDELTTSEETDIYVLEIGTKVTMNVKFEHLWSQFEQEGRAPYYIDAWMRSEAGAVLTYKQRYVLTNEYNEFDDLFIFENSLGGVDVIRFTGELENQVAHEFKTALFGEETREYDIIFNQVFSKNTGYFRNGYELLWTKDFLSSLNRHHYFSGLPVRIVVKSYEAKDVKTELNHFNFTFSYSKQSRYLNNASVIGQLPAMMAEFSGMPSVWDDIYVRIFGDQVVDGVKTFLQPIMTNEVQPASGSNLVLNDLTVKDGGIIDCGEF